MPQLRTNGCQHRPCYHIRNTPDTPVVDVYLDHLWAARRGLIKRCKTRKTNRRLRIRIAKLTQEAADYAQHLSQQNWAQFCTKLQGTLGTRRTWYLLKALMGNNKTQTAVAHQLRRLIQNLSGTQQELLEELKNYVDPSFIGIGNTRK